VSLSKLIRKREVATATVATLATLPPKYTPSVATVASVAVANPKPEPDFLPFPANDNLPKTDCIDTLETDYAELQAFITELCRIAGHTEEAKAIMLGKCRGIFPFQVAEQRDYFRQQVELATAGTYWTIKATH
jgi:hypothetical protein